MTITVNTVENGYIIRESEVDRGTTATYVAASDEDLDAIVNDILGKVRL